MDFSGLPEYKTEYFAQTLSGKNFNMKSRLKQRSDYISNILMIV